MPARPRHAAVFACAVFTVLSALTAVTAGCASAPAPPAPEPLPTADPVLPRWILERPTFFVAGQVDGSAFARWAAEVPLPAVSEDGALVALGRAGSDGARGNPNYRVRVVRVADGAVLLDTVVLDADEVDPGEAPDPPDDPGAAETPASRPPPLEARVVLRVDEANDALAQHRWVRLATALDDLSGPADPEQAFGEPFVGPLGRAQDGLAVTYAEPRLGVTLGGRVVVDATHPEWRAPERSMCAPEEREGLPPEEVEACGCHNPASLDSGVVDLARGVLVLRLRYHGTDLCWEPDVLEVVVPLPRLKRQ